MYLLCTRQGTTGVAMFIEEGKPQKKFFLVARPLRGGGREG